MNDNVRRLPLVNNSLVHKLESMSQDIKVYVNTNYGQIGQHEDGADRHMSQDEYDELICIRTRIKVLASTLSERLKKYDMYVKYQTELTNLAQRVNNGEKDAYEHIWSFANSYGMIYDEAYIIVKDHIMKYIINK